MPRWRRPKILQKFEEHFKFGSQIYWTNVLNDEICFFQWKFCWNECFLNEMFLIVKFLKMNVFWNESFEWNERTNRSVELFRMKFLCFTRSFSGFKRNFLRCFYEAESLTRAVKLGGFDGRDLTCGRRDGDSRKDGSRRSVGGRDSQSRIQNIPKSGVENRKNYRFP